MLYVKDFCTQRIVSSQQIIEAVEKVPKAHLLGLEYIVYDPVRFFQRSYVQVKPINYNVLGSYNRIPKKFITIHKFANEREFYQVLYHEIGHHVFNHILPSDKRVNWVNHVYPNSTSFVSEYASKNAQEDFCESYASFYIDAHMLLKDIKKYTFIKQCMLHLT